MSSLGINETLMNVTQMSLLASVMILVIIIVRAFTINRLPKKVFVLLWEVALLRLLVPFSIPSVFSIYSLVGRSDVIQKATDGIPAISKLPAISGITAISEIVRGTEGQLPVSNGSVLQQQAGANLSVWTLLWITGFILCMVFFAVSYLRCDLEFRTSLPVQNEAVKKWLNEHPLRRSIQIRQSDRIQAPLTYGIFRPVILMPKRTDWENSQQLQYVLLHEYIHICRFDAVLKLILILALCIHWFNPFVWAMYILCNRDIELSCDERVVGQFGEASKSAYARTLITMEEKKSGLTPLYNNFSKNAIEERITAIMKSQKATVGILSVSVLVVVSIVALFATSAAGQREQKLLVMGRMYTSTQEDVSDAVAREAAVSEYDSPHIGYIESTVNSWQTPLQEFQSNFGYEGAEIVFQGNGIAVNMDGRWIHFSPGESATATPIDEKENQESGEKAAQGIVAEGIDTSGPAFWKAKELVEEKYAEMKEQGYLNWRIKTLAHVYTYENLGGARIQVYQLDYDFLAADPQKVTLAGGMTMDEEGWVVPEYAGGTYILLVAETGVLSPMAIVENDCFPGDEVFTADLKKLLGFE